MSRRGLLLFMTVSVLWGVPYLLISAEGPARAAFITYVAPVVAVSAGVLLLSEPVTARTVAGASLVLAGAALAVRRPGRPVFSRVSR
jgi:drug/metabolite transporter (DMT)-like permease